MSTLEAQSPWLVRVVDWANPILVKELRQSLKSRQFVVTFMLLVTAAWFVSVFGLLIFPNEVQYGPAGRFFFLGFYVALAVATLLIVPFTSYKSLTAERDFNTYEILSVTTITPRQIVHGRLASSLVQCLIYYSAITPFIAFSSTMQGFDSLRAAYILVVTLLISMMLSLASLVVSTLSKQRATQGLFSIILVGQLIGAAFAAFSLAMMMIFQTGVSITDTIFWQFNAVGLLIYITYFILFQQIAIANLTFESDNHSTGIRVTAMAQFWMLWLVAFGYCYYEGVKVHPMWFLVFAIISMVHWAIFGLAFTAEMDSLSRRIRRNFPQSKARRLVMIPFLPGGARGYVFFLFHVIAIWLLYAIGMTNFARGGWYGGLLNGMASAWDSQDRQFMMVTAICLQLVIYGGVNTALARWGQAISEVVRPAHARVVTFLMLMAAVVGPQILYVTELIDRPVARYSYLQVLDPVNTAIFLGNRPDSRAGLIIALLLVFAIIAVLVNLPAMIQGAVRVLNSHVRTRKPADIKPLPDYS